MASRGPSAAAPCRRCGSSDHWVKDCDATTSVQLRHELHVRVQNSKRGAAKKLLETRRRLLRKEARREYAQAKRLEEAEEQHDLEMLRQEILAAEVQEKLGANGIAALNERMAQELAPLQTWRVGDSAQQPK